MKVVIMTLENANKIGIEGAGKLAKTDSLIFLYVNGKKNISDEVEEALEEVKAQVEYVSMKSNSDMNVILAYYVGFHNAKNHDVFVITPDKEKINDFTAKNAKVYSSFRSIAAAAGKKTSTSKKTSEKSEDELSDMLTDLASGKMDAEDLTKKVLNMAIKNLK